MAELQRLRADVQAATIEQTEFTAVQLQAAESDRRAAAIKPPSRKQRRVLRWIVKLWNLWLSRQEVQVGDWPSWEQVPFVRMQNTFGEVWVRCGRGAGVMWVRCG